MKQYFVSIVPSRQDGYTCWFADFPEAFTQGSTLEEAIEMAEDVLRIWMEDYEPIGTKQLPEPSSIEDVMQFINNKIEDEPGMYDSSKEIHHQLISPSIN